MAHFVPMDANIGNDSVTKPGRRLGSRNARSIKGENYLKSLNAPARRRLKRIIEESKDDKLALNAAKLVLSYSFGQPVQRREVSGPNGGPQQHLTSFGDLEKFLQRRETVNGGALDSHPAQDGVGGRPEPDGVSVPALTQNFSDLPEDAPPENYEESSGFEPEPSEDDIWDELVAQSIAFRSEPPPEPEPADEAEARSSTPSPSTPVEVTDDPPAAAEAEAEVFHPGSSREQGRRRW